MKLNLTYQELNALYGANLVDQGKVYHSVSYDSRRIINGPETIFFAFKGEFRDGHQFIHEAYQTGVRIFVVNSQQESEKLVDAQFIIVSDTLRALQALARYHRTKFNCEVIGITGSSGKTSVKEILGGLIQEKFNVVRSPKSYNSQLGVALSLLSLTPETEVALIEAGISKPGEMEKLQEIIQPTIGILTSIGTAHIENFENQAQLLGEKTKLFINCKTVILPHSVSFNGHNETIRVRTSEYDSLIPSQQFIGVMRENAAIALVAGIALGCDMDYLSQRLTELRPIAMRMETFDGINNSTIINDTYNLNKEGLIASLQFQLAISNGKRRILFAGASRPELKSLVKSVVQDFDPIEVYFNDETDPFTVDVANSVVLFKGDRKSKMEEVATRLRQFKHETYLEINLGAIRRNLHELRSQLPQSTKMLAMVKASSYGSGAENLALFLERTGIEYLGVAYPDEGAELRRAGVKLPIMVMNTEPGSFGFCIDNKLEPAIYSTSILDDFIRELVYRNLTDYPIHIKLETGMNRLGLLQHELNELIDILQSQPEVRIKSIYSHLATSDECDSIEVHNQAQRFLSMAEEIESKVGYGCIKHLLNSEGIINYPDYHFDMVRVGIAMYGVSTNQLFASRLKPALKWFTSITQVKQVKKGERIGYGGQGTLDRDGKIAVIPIGYADGFRRILSNGNGGVFINDTFCLTVGNICMDMTMVDVTGLNVRQGDRVEIIGDHQQIESLALRMETIPYEVLTGVSKRVHRLYIED